MATRGREMVQVVGGVHLSHKIDEQTERALRQANHRESSMVYPIVVSQYQKR